ncbi:ATP-binding protein [Herbaspirillum sp. GCM10030257]|uniref:ATP-binding protein n=1 Tax=Herbaspirillum sp. GCM10030257 TaxID=3273393 RepID=UPI003618983A
MLPSTTQDSVLDDLPQVTHFARFYDEDAQLINEVADFLDGALRKGGVAIVIATPDHIAGLRQHLTGFGSVQGQPGWFSGELITLDAEVVLAQFMVDDWPDEARFHDTVGKIVREACAKGETVNAFGEMVALLCAEGLYDAAIRLEQLWNGLRDDYSFSLFCAYPWRLFPTIELAESFQQVCAEHDHVCSVGGHLHTSVELHDIHLKTTQLEQKARALQVEVDRLKESEQTLKHREKEFADFVENAAEGLHRVGPDGTILWANKAELAMLGYSWEEYIGHHIAQFHADQPTIETVLNKLLAGETLLDQPARLRCKDGSIKHVVISSNGCFKGGQLRYTRCFTRDATERQQLEQMYNEREALLAELTRANRAKDEFLAMLAHELRNPLAPISAAAQLLELAASDPVKVKQAAGIISRQAGYLTALIDDLLDVARVTRGLIVIDKNPVDFRQVLSDAIEQMTPHISARQHNLSLHLPPEPANVVGDRKRLVQIVTNLLANAAKYTPEGGNITARLQVSSGQVVLKISDNGIGMAPDLLAKAFDLFSQGERTSDRSQGGLGLGLALVKTLVELHSGSAHADSAGIGQGSTFTIRIPVVTNASNEVKAPSVSGEQTIKATQGLRLMIVDDNVDAADTLSLLLKAMGHEVFTEYTAAKGIDRIREIKPEVALLDIGLPDIDGKDLARRLRTMPEGAKTVLIAVTGYGQEHDKKESSAAGFDYHFVKPVNIEELSMLLASLSVRKVGV